MTRFQSKPKSQFSGPLPSRSKLFLQPCALISWQCHNPGSFWKQDFLPSTCFHISSISRNWTDNKYMQGFAPMLIQEVITTRKGLRTPWHCEGNRIQHKLYEGFNEFSHWFIFLMAQYTPHTELNSTYGTKWVKHGPLSGSSVWDELDNKQVHTKMYD